MSNKKQKFQVKISGAQITCQAHPDSNIKPMISTECMNKIPFLEDGAEYDSAKQKFASWNKMCWGCCHKQSAGFPIKAVLLYDGKGS